MAGWKDYKLSEIASFKYGKMPKSNLLYKGEFPVFSGYRIVGTYPEWNCEKGQVVIVARGVGGTGDVKIAKEKCFVTNLSLIANFNNEVLDNTYFYYKYLLSNLMYLDSGSAQSQITVQDLSKVIISLPSLPDQQAIAEVLSSLDDKIDLLHRQNQTLEALAETLFRRWFIEEAEESWGNGFVTDLIDLNPKRSLRKDTIAPYLEMGNLSNELYHPHDWYDRIFTSGTKFINGDTLLARITPCLENGKTAYVDFLKDDEVGWGSTEFIVMRPKATLHPFFSYILARHNDFRNFAIGCMVGTSGRQRADVDNLATYEMKLPPPDVIKRFNKHIESSLQKMKLNNNQIRSLIKLRDTLLPKLMSGEVRVKITGAETATVNQ